MTVRMNSVWLVHEDVFSSIPQKRYLESITSTTNTEKHVPYLEIASNMIKSIAVAAVLSSIPVASGIPGWFRNVPRGGTTYYHGLYPDAVANAVHGYAELDKRTDEKIDEVHEVKTSTPPKDALWSDEDYEEDPFFHALYHNNDADNSVVNVSREKTSHERVDTELFERLNDKLFHHDVDEDDVGEPTEKVTYSLREIMEDSVGFE